MLRALKTSTSRLVDGPAIATIDAIAGAAQLERMADGSASYKDGNESCLSDMALNTASSHCLSSNLLHCEEHQTYTITVPPHPPV